MAQRESSSPSLGETILAELDRRDRAYYYWSILAFVIAFLPMLIAYPPWQLSGQYFPANYALSQANGSDPYIEILYCVGVRLSVGLIAKAYFALIRFRDNFLSVMAHEE